MESIVWQKLCGHFIQTLTDLLPTERKVNGVFEDAADSCGREIALPPKPCTTRWGTWLEAVRYYTINLPFFAEVITLTTPTLLLLKPVKRYWKSTMIWRPILYIWILISWV
jgi:hypothetical protein